MLETLLGGVFGGLLRLAPELFKMFDHKDERKHELAMLNAEMEFAKIRGEIALRQVDASLQRAELDSIGEAFKEQYSTARASYKWATTLSALVRPLITYAFVIAYFLVKVAAYLMAITQGGAWKEVLVSMWTADDTTIMFMIISFWFVGRVFERNPGGR